MLRRNLKGLLVAMVLVGGAYACDSSLACWEFKTLEKTIDNGFKWTEKSMGLDGYAEQKDVK